MASIPDMPWIPNPAACPPAAMFVMRAVPVVSNTSPHQKQARWDRLSDPLFRSKKTPTV